MHENFLKFLVFLLFLGLPASLVLKMLKVLDKYQDQFSTTCQVLLVKVDSPNVT